MNIVIPMAGAGSRFAKAGYEKPKPFIDVLGKPMICRVLDNLQYRGANFILLARKEHMDAERSLVEQIQKEYGAVFVPIDKLTEGTASTVLYAREFINSEVPLMIANSDQIVDIDIGDFINDAKKRCLDGSILTFVDAQKDPKWSFAKINTNGYVVEVQEKKPISEYATVGIYFFAKGKYFVDSAIDMIVRNERINNEFYTCPVYNYMIGVKKQVGIYNIDHTQMHGIGTPDDLQSYIDKIQ